ncbi:MAG: hypothetical protein M0R17_10575 [Candidatus Omnitrophica bacterium]|jgi:hypothetical protein|nr:hypothetical protein [Candidatus Omnitrophota bacterium]
MKQKILNIISDLCSNFLYYDRKEDEELSTEQLYNVVKTNIITIDEMTSEFKKHLLATLPNVKNENINNEQLHDMSWGNDFGYLVTINVDGGNQLEQRIVVAKDVFEVEQKVKQSFKKIDWWEIKCIYGILVTPMVTIH